MDLVIIVALLGVVWIAGRTRERASAERRAERDKQVTKEAKKYPEGMPPARRRAVARHATRAWWAREVLSGGSVHRSAWHAAWLEHKAAADQQKALREEARTKHAEVRQSYRQVADEHRRRRAEIAAETDKRLAKDPGLLTSGRGKVAEAVTEGADEVARKRAEKQERQEAAGQTAPAPEPGPFATRRPDGEPETDADRRFFDERAAGYGGPLDQDGRRLEPGSPLNPDLYVSPELKSATNGGEQVPTKSAEMTYDQCIQRANATINECEVRLAELRIQQIAQMADSLVPVLRDGATLGRLAEADDSVQQEIRACQATKESMESFRDGLRHDHGGMNEAHQNAPVAGAQPEFYEG